jgi:hypothetical protein
MRDTSARRLDTKEKIELGGLVVKAGLRKADRAFLLGGLLSLAKIQPGSDLYAAMQREGHHAFLTPGPSPASKGPASND